MENHANIFPLTVLVVHCLCEKSLSHPSATAAISTRLPKFLLSPHNFHIPCTTDPEEDSLTKWETHNNPDLSA